LLLMECQIVDIVFIAAGGVLWAAAVLLTLGQQRLDRQDGRSAATGRGGS
jgi:hypothetical protein